MILLLRRQVLKNCQPCYLMQTSASAQQKTTAQQKESEKVDSTIKHTGKGERLVRPNRMRERLLTDDLLMSAEPPSTTAMKQEVNSTSIVSKPDDVQSKIYFDFEMAVEPTEMTKPRQLELGTRLVVPFDEVPGPMMFKIAGQVMKIIPFVGSNLSWPSHVRPFNYLFDNYGPVVRIHRGLFGGDIVMICRPEHMAQIYSEQGATPIRSCIDVVDNYRLQRTRKLFVPPNVWGSQFDAMRKNIVGRIADASVKHHEKLERTAMEMVYRIKMIRNIQQEVPSSFHTDLCKWSLECMTLMLFNRHMGFLDETGLMSDSETYRVLHAFLDATHYIRKCQSGIQFWRLWDTFWVTKVAENCTIIDNLTIDELKQTKKKMDEVAHKLGISPVPPESIGSIEMHSLLDYMVLSGDLTYDEILTIMMDMIIIGANTTANAAGFLMYHLARNPRVQKILYDEVKTAQSKPNSQLDPKEIPKLHYMKACLMESLRLRPPIPYTTHYLEKDTTLHGYEIPKGTYVVMAGEVTGMKEDIFEDAHSFKPERWLEKERQWHPFAAIPFGHGIRACIGRELAERQIIILIAKILRNYWIGYHYGEIRNDGKSLAQPTRPFRFTFSPRTNI